MASGRPDAYSLCCTRAGLSNITNQLTAALRMQAKADNKLLQVRGNAGTHDLQLGEETLRALQVSLCFDVKWKMES